MNKSTHIESKNNYREAKLEGLLPYVEIVLAWIDQVTPALKQKLRNYYELLQCVSIAKLETINEVISGFRVEPIFKNANTQFMITEFWYRTFLDILYARWIVGKLGPRMSVNSKVEELIWK